MPFEASETDLWPIFSEYGNILELVVLKTPQGRSRGCGFVIYENKMMAEKAIQQVDGKVRTINWTLKCWVMSMGSFRYILSEYLNRQSCTYSQLHTHHEFNLDT